MHKTFQPTISADFLEMMEDSPVGKALIEKAGISAFKMLSRFTLNLPIESNPNLWLVECDANLAYNPPDIILFLKYAWLYSEREENEHIDNLIHSVAQELTSFEKDLLIKGERKKLNEVIESLSHREEETRSIQNELKQSQSELKINRQKEKEISIRNSTSASKSRGCEEVDKYIQGLVKSNPYKSIKELWFLISGERDGGEFYRETTKCIMKIAMTIVMNLVSKLSTRE